jgi:phospholipid/cholesterol/gamma-HCH transport system permease protein
MSPVARVGALVLRVVRELGQLVLLGGRVLRALVSPAMEWREALREAGVFGVGSLPVLAATAALVGGILVVQAGLYVRRFGVQELVGWFVGFGVLREVGPLVAGLVFSGRVGSRNAAEIAAMATRDQLEGLRAIGVDVVPTVVAPRALAMVGSLVSLYVLGAVVSIATAAASAWVLLDVDPWQFQRSFVERTLPSDLAAGLTKSGAFAGAVALASCRVGLAARGGATAVGEAAKQAVVRGAFAIVVLDLVVARFF